MGCKYFKSVRVLPSYPIPHFCPHFSTYLLIHLLVRLFIYWFIYFFTLIKSSSQSSFFFEILINLYFKNTAVISQHNIPLSRIHIDMICFEMPPWYIKINEYIWYKYDYMIWTTSMLWRHIFALWLPVLYFVRFFPLFSRYVGFVEEPLDRKSVV